MKTIDMKTEKMDQKTFLTQLVEFNKKLGKTFDYYPSPCGKDMDL